LASALPVESRAFPLPYLLVAAAVLLFVRRPDAILNPQFYAEDGRTFFMDAYNLGAWSLVKPYNGGYYLIHRLIAYLGSFVPIAYAPCFYNAFAVAATLGAVAYIAKSRVAGRFTPLMALALVAIPTNGEMFSNVVNVHWVLSLLLLTLLISPPERGGRRMLADASLALPIALTGPFSLLWAPLFGLRAVVERTRPRILLFLVVAFGAAVQLAVLDSRRSAGLFQLFDTNWLGAFGNGVSGVLLLGLGYAKKVPNSLFLTLLSLAIYGALIAHAFLKRDARRLMLLAAGLAVLASTAIAYRRAPEYLSRHVGNRYAYIPTVSLVWVLVLTLGDAGKAARLAAVLLGVAAVASVTRFPARAFVDYDWREASLAIGGPEPAMIPINPPGWSVTYFPRRTGGGMAAWTVPFDQPVLVNEADNAMAKSADVFVLAKPTFVYGVRVRFAPAGGEEEAARYHFAWDRSRPSVDGRTEEIAPLSLKPGGFRESTVWVFDAIDHFCVHAIRRGAAWKIVGAKLFLRPDERGVAVVAPDPATDHHRSWLPVSGDWDGDGIDSVGLFDPASGRFFLTDQNAAGPANRVLRVDHSDSEVLPLAGDWDGDRTTTPAVYRPRSGTFYLQSGPDTVGAGEGWRFGPRDATGVPLGGNWAGGGGETVGLFDPAESQFNLAGANAPAESCETFRFGPRGAGWLPIVGDWDGDGKDTAGLYDPVSGKFHLRNSNTAGTGDVMIPFGPKGGRQLPVAGDWDGNGIDAVGLYDPLRGQFLLHEGGDNHSADMRFRFGPRHDVLVPLVRGGRRVASAP
jgi:hypothetical protein